LNVYEDAERAAAYATLEFPGTYYLAFRDLPEIIGKHVSGTRAVDFGCGAGRSTRFLKTLGFDAIGVDIAEDMLILARERDPKGDYRRVETAGLRELEQGAFDLVFSAFTFDNIPTMETKVALFAGLRDLLRPGGKIINMVSSPEIYTYDWASFTNTCFAGNFSAKRGDSVFTIMNDILWPDDAYHETYAAAKLAVEQVCRPLGRESDPCAYVSEMTVAPWVIWVLRKDEG